MPKWRHRGLDFRFNAKIKIITKDTLDRIAGAIKTYPIPLTEKKSVARFVRLLKRYEKSLIHRCLIARRVNTPPINPAELEMWEIDEYEYLQDNKVALLMEQFEYILNGGIKVVDKSIKVRYKGLVKTE